MLKVFTATLAFTMTTTVAMAAPPPPEEVPIPATNAITREEVAQAMGATSGVRKKTTLRLGKRTLKSCNDLIKYYKPSHTPRGAKYNVRCVNRTPKGSGNTAGLIHYYYADKSKKYATGPYTVTILNTGDAQTMRGVLDHEMWHMRSLQWGRKKQANYLRAIGAKNWTSGKTYHTKAPERWAWAANSCYAPRGSPFRSSKYERLLPGGCSFVRKWQRRPSEDGFSPPRVRLFSCPQRV